MRAGIGLSRHPDPERACVDAAEHAMLQAGRQGPPDLLWVVTVSHTLVETQVGLELAARRTQARHSVACTAAAVHVSPAPVEADGMCVAGALVLYGSDRLSVVDNHGRRPGVKGNPVITLMDPQGQLGTLMGAVEPLWDPARVAGFTAACTDGDAGVLHEGNPGVEAVHILPGMPAVEVAVASGVSPVGRPMVVTRVDGSLVLELDDRPALERVMEQLPLRARGEPVRALSRCMVALAPSGTRQADLDRGAMTARPLVGVARNTGAVAVGESPVQGTWLQLVRKDPAHAERALQRALLDLKYRVRGASPVCALYFTCKERGRGLFGRPHVEIQRIHRALGRVPVLGMAGGLQLGPHLHGAVGLHMLSGVLMVLGEGN